MAAAIAAGDAAYAAIMAEVVKLTAQQIRNNLLAYEDNVIASCKILGAQGAIIWESGDDFPPYDELKYLGVPDLFSPYFPKSYLDQFFKRITDAGLRVGGCIRPGQIIRNLQGNLTSVSSASGWQYDYGERLNFGREQWGWTLAYFDSMVYADVPFPVGPMEEIIPYFPNYSIFGECVSGPEWAAQIGLYLMPSLTAPFPTQGVSLMHPLDSQSQYTPGWAARAIAARKAGNIIFGFKGWCNDWYNVVVEQMEKAAKVG